MCWPAALGALGLGGTAAAGATAAGATAAATGVGFWQTLGTVVGAGGAILQGVQGAQAARAQTAAIEQQAETERRLNATEDQRRRAQFMSAISQQRAELAARGVTLDSPTAVMLGQTAAQELSFESQSVRSGGAARQAELSASAAMSRARGVSSLLRGTFSAADTILTAAPDLWPGFNRRMAS